MLQVSQERDWSLWEVLQTLLCGAARTRSSTGSVDVNVQVLTGEQFCLILLQSIEYNGGCIRYDKEAFRLTSSPRCIPPCKEMQK